MSFPDGVRKRVWTCLSIDTKTLNLVSFHYVVLFYRFIPIVLFDHFICIVPLEPMGLFLSWTVRFTINHTIHCQPYGQPWTVRFNLGLGPMPNFPPFLAIRRGLGHVESMDPTATSPIHGIFLERLRQSVHNRTTWTIHLAYIRLHIHGWRSCTIYSSRLCNFEHFKDNLCFIL